jgi:hypothetical protein
LALFDELGLERPFPVTRHFDVDMPLLSFERFLALPIAVVARGVALACMFGVAQMRVQFRFQAAFNYRFGQFFQQATFPENVLGCVVIFEQFIDQLASNPHGFLRTNFSVSRILPLPQTIVQSLHSMRSALQSL